MPYNFRFVKADGTDATLNDVDREMCEDTGKVYDSANYCPMFVELTQWIGLAILSQSNGDSIVTAESFDSFRSSERGKGIDFKKAEWTLARKYLVEKYAFELWYSR